MSPPPSPQRFRNSDPAVIIGNFPWTEMVWRSLRGDFKPLAEPAGGYDAFAREWSVPVDHARIAQRQQAPTVTWLGHVTVLLQVAGLNILIDPTLGTHAGPWGRMGALRRVPAPLQPAQLPPIDVVLISHNHYDHLDDASVIALNAQPGGPPLFIVPLGLKAWLAEQGITQRVVELDWWQSHRVSGAEVVLTPAQHWSGRGLHDRLATLWGGFAVFMPDYQWFYSGDTGYSKDFADIRARFADRQTDGGFDLALIPVGAYEPRWFMATQHVNPAEAVQIHRDVRARRSLGVHWGTFSLTDEPLDQPPHDLAIARRAAGLADDAFFVMAVGETRRLPPRRRAAAPLSR